MASLSPWLTQSLRLRSTLCLRSYSTLTSRLPTALPSGREGESGSVARMYVCGAGFFLSVCELLLAFAVSVSCALRDGVGRFLRVVLLVSVVSCCVCVGGPLGVIPPPWGYYPNHMTLRSYRRVPNLRHPCLSLV